LIAGHTGRACEKIDVLGGDRGPARRGDAPISRSRGEDPSNCAVELRSTADELRAGTATGEDALAAFAGGI